MGSHAIPCAGSNSRLLYAGEVARTAGSRTADRLQVPAAMRRDVRMLGEMLGQVIRESEGDDLLADVEDLRRRVIAVREHDLDAGNETGRSADDEIAALIASWPMTRAEAVARAFTVYFHLANLAEEHQRVRILRERDAGATPVRESLSAAIESIAGAITPTQRESLLGRLEVHPVLTAHPTEARRRAVTEALRRIGAALATLDDAALGATDRTEASRRLREEIDLLWRTSPLRIQAMQPLDEARSGVAIFDETLFELAPRLYRELDRALQAQASGYAPAMAPAFLRFGSWICADRDGNPFVTAAVTDQAARIQADHALRALENATTRIGRSLTIDMALLADTGSAGGGSGRSQAVADLGAAIAAAELAHPVLIGDLSSRSPGEPFRTFLLYAAQRLYATRLGRGLDDAGPRPSGSASEPGVPGLAYESSADFLADLRLVQDALAAAGAVRQAYGGLQHLIWQAETFGFHLAEMEIRQRGELHEVSPRHRGCVRACRAGLHGTAAAARCHSLVRKRRRSGQCGSDPGRHDRACAGCPPPGADQPAPGGHARLLGLSQGAWHGQRHAPAVRRAAPASPLGGGQRHQAGAVPWPGRCPRARRRAGWPGRARTSPWIGGRSVQGHRARRGDLRKVW